MVALHTHVKQLELNPVGSVVPQGGPMTDQIWNSRDHCDGRGAARRLLLSSKRETTWPTGRRCRADGEKQKDFKGIKHGVNCGLLRK